MRAAEPLATRTVVLLHGCGGSVRATFDRPGWRAALTATGARVVAPDLPGHGRHACSQVPAAYADLAGLVETTLPAGRFDLIGFSLGGKLALELALRHPDRVGRVVLGGVGDNVFAPERVAPLAAAALEAPGSDAARHPLLQAMLQRFEHDLNDRLAVAAVLRRPPNPVFTPQRLRGLRSPVLLVNGSDDPAGQDATQLAAALPQLERHTLPGVGHFELPEQSAFRAHALRFLGLEIPTA